MLDKKTPSKKTFAGFVATDIENWPDGSVLSINTCWREAGQKVHAKHEQWGPWWDWLKSRAVSDARFRIVYAHNGGGWDWLSFIHYLLSEGRETADAIKICQAGSKIIVAMIACRVGGNRFTIRLADSLQLLRSPLGSKGVPGKPGYKPGLAIRFAGREKTDLGGRLPHVVYQQDRALFERYESEDTELLLEVLENALTILQQKVAAIETFASTIGGTAMKVFRTIGLKKPLMIPTKPALKTFLREGYAGGRVECFRPGVYKSVNVYDVNSLYPYAMLTTAVPTTDRGVWIDAKRGARRGIKPDDCGLYEIEWSQSNRKLAPILTLKGEGAYEGRGVFYTPELQLIKEIDPGVSIVIHKGFAFLDRATIFRPFVRKLYTLRKSDPGGPLSELCKFLLNSLYGKFGQHAVRESVVAALSPDDLFERVANGEKIRPLNRAAGLWLDDFGKADRPDLAELPVPVYGILSETHCEFEHVGIAGIITSAARALLYRGILAAGFERVIYCDTDSVHCVGNLPSHMVGSEIGEFKLETLPGTSGAYAGKKLYALRFANGAEKVRAKGVSVGGVNGADLCYSDVCSFVEGNAKALTYKQPTTLLEMFGGAQPCVFQTRKRTLRKTAKDCYEKVSGSDDGFHGLAIGDLASAPSLSGR